MMKMSGRVTSCCVALFFALTSVTAVPRLNSISELKRINFGQAVPKHSLLLLCWFASTVDIVDDDNIRLNFNPNTGDYGSHHYGNYEGLLNPLPRGSGYKYFTVGNLRQETPVELPSYVTRPQREYVGRNRDRIIIRVREQNTGWGGLPRIDQVYITQHPTNQRIYDPAHTYQITTNLLRQIREFSVEQNQQQLQHLRNRYGSNADVFDIRNTWGNLAGLGLLLFIVIQEKYSSNRQSRNGNRRNDLDDDSSESKSNDSRGFRNQDEIVVDFHDNEEDHKAIRMTGNRESGSYNTSKPCKNTQRSPCCICCIVSIGLILLCIIVALLYYLKKR